MAKLSKAFPSSAKLDSRYRRMQRFVSDSWRIDYDVVACFIMGLFGFLDNDYDLILDRTNWRWGKKDINILMLGVVYKGVAIPIYWILLPKKGNSSTRERIALLKRFIKQFGKERLVKLFADREFIGEAWFKWLKSEDSDFGIRIKKNSLVTNSQGKIVQVKTLFRFLKAGEALTIPEARQVTGVSVYLSALRLPDGKLLIVAQGKYSPHAIEDYGKRWQIETLFSCLKGRGFNFEDTHITDRRRIKRFLIIVVIAFCWAHRVGEWQHEQVKPLHVKKHGRLAKSIFRLGMDLINEALFSWFYTSENTLKSLFPFISRQHGLSDG